MLAKCFKPALPYLDVDMMDICKENGAYDAKHFLCYYYYGGMIYTGLKNFERALYFYEQVTLTKMVSLKCDQLKGKGSMCNSAQRTYHLWIAAKDSNKSCEPNIKYKHS